MQTSPVFWLFDTQDDGFIFFYLFFIHPKFFVDSSLGEIFTSDSVTAIKRSRHDEEEEEDFAC